MNITDNSPEANPEIFLSEIKQITLSNQKIKTSKSNLHDQNHC